MHQYFQRFDESDDENFYQQPRLVVHIDDAAITATTALYRQLLPPNSVILDLMSSWRSHLPTDVPFARVAGLGMNAEEMRQNPQLTDHLVQNLNKTPTLPYPDATFDGCVCTVSVQYLTNPIAVFADVARILRPGAPFAVTFSNRMFPTKAVAIWQSLDDAGHQALVRSYFEQAGDYETIEDVKSKTGRWHDPLLGVVGWRKK
jgi:SAM-dependent methyltransferase